MFELKLQNYRRHDGVPFTLKGLLCNRACHWRGGWGYEHDRQVFIDYYEDYIKKMPKRSKGEEILKPHDLDFREVDFS